RGEVGSSMRPDAVLAARLRRPGARAFLGSPRAFPAAVRGAEHAGLRALDAGANVPHAAAAGEATLPQAAHRDDSEELAATQALGLFARGSRRWRVPARDRRDRRSAARERDTCRILLGQGLLRSARVASFRR